VGREDVSLLEQLAEFSQSAGEYGSAMEYYEQILAIAQKARESSDLLSQIFFKMGCCRSHTGEYRKALDLLDAAEHHLSEHADPLARSRIANERAFALIALGEYDRAEACVQDVTESWIRRPPASWPVPRRHTGSSRCAAGSGRRPAARSRRHSPASV
jgi:tetratricopeptide (TPR) repeat protein